MPTQCCFLATRAREHEYICEAFTSCHVRMHARDNKQEYLREMTSDLRDKEDTLKPRLPSRCLLHKAYTSRFLSQQNQNHTSDDIKRMTRKRTQCNTSFLCIKSCCTRVTGEVSTERTRSGPCARLVRARLTIYTSSRRTSLTVDSDLSCMCVVCVCESVVSTINFCVCLRTCVCV